MHAVVVSTSQPERIDSGQDLQTGYGKSQVANYYCKKLLFSSLKRTPWQGARQGLFAPLIQGQKNSRPQAVEREADQSPKQMPISLAVSTLSSWMSTIFFFLVASSKVTFCMSPLTRDTM